MEEMTIQEQPGLFAKIAGYFRHTEEAFEEHEPAPVRSTRTQNTVHAPATNYRLTMTVRRQVMSNDDAMAAANGLKRGEPQILNLTGTDPVTRQRIVDFMSGISFYEGGTWEEIGDNIYLLAPTNAYVEVAPPTPRMHSTHN